MRALVHREQVAAGAESRRNLTLSFFAFSESSASPHWVGDGFRVYPVFANTAFTEEISPMLMFDYAEPKKFPAKFGPPLGVGQHPHRGFETVTVAFQGEVEHQDSTGTKDVIGQGDVQWYVVN